MAVNVCNALADESDGSFDLLQIGECADTNIPWLNSQRVRVDTIPLSNGHAHNEAPHNTRAPY